MNCKPGDLALVVSAKAWPQLLGLIVEVVEFVPDGSIHPSDFPRWKWQHASGSDTWLVRHPRMGQWLHADPSLRPIRPSSQEDETETVKEMESV